MTALEKVNGKLASDRVSHLSEVAETIRDDAVALACRKLHIIQSPEVKGLLERPSFLDRFTYGMACGVAEVLSASDQRVRAVYIQDTVDNPENEVAAEIPPQLTISLIVLVTTVSAAMESLIVSLDRALLASLKELGSPHFTGREFILDVIVVTEEQVRLGIGYGHMLKSIFTPPLKIWQREE